MSIDSMYKKLLKLSNNNPEWAEKIIEEAISNNYSGFFKLKEDFISIKKESAEENYNGYWEVQTISQNGKNVEIMTNEKYLYTIEWCKNPNRYPMTTIEKAVKTNKKW